jgi:hypothetical protein
MRRSREPSQLVRQEEKAGEEEDAWWMGVGGVLRLPHPAIAAIHPVRVNTPG